MSEIRMARRNKAQLSKISEEPFMEICILLIISLKINFWEDGKQDAATCLKKY